MKDYIYVMSVDPGNNTGITMFKVSIPDFKILDIDTHNIILDHFDNNLVVNGKILNRLNALKTIITKITYDYQPTLVAFEAAFLNMKFPKAVIQLSQYIAVMESAVLTVSKKIKILRYPPLKVKKQLQTSNVSKLSMYEAVKAIPELNSKIKIKELTEHQIDSIAIGYTLILELRTYPYYILAM